MWEDDANKQGGRWLISLEKKQRNNELDIYWLDIVSITNLFIKNGLEIPNKMFVLILSIQ